MMDTQEHYRKKDSQQIANQSMIISQLRNENASYKETIKAMRKEIKQLKRGMR
jgi:cell division protein FtsB